MYFYLENPWPLSISILTIYMTKLTKNSHFLPSHDTIQHNFLVFFTLFCFLQTKQQIWPVKEHWIAQGSTEHFEAWLTNSLRPMQKNVPIK